MNISKRLFTYPVLCSENDDYINAEFSVVVRVERVDLDSLKFIFDVTLKCLDIQELINTNKADFVMHIECSATAFRTVVRGASTQLEYIIPASKLRDSVELMAFIVAKVDLKEFTSTSWNEDFAGDSFDLVKGKLLAYQNLPTIKITKNFEELQNVTSIFKLCKITTDEERPFDVDMDCDYIKILLPSKDYTLFTNYSNKPGWPTVLNNMLILPSLVFIFSELQLENSYDRYANRAWYQALKAAYKKRGMDLEDKLSDKAISSLRLAQEAMELPFSKGLVQLPILTEQGEVEEA